MCDKTVPFFFSCRVTNWLKMSPEHAVLNNVQEFTSRGPIHINQIFDEN